MENPPLSPKEIEIFENVVSYDFRFENPPSLELFTRNETIACEGSEAVRTMEKFQWWRKSLQGP